MKATVVFILLYFGLTFNCQVLADHSCAKPPYAVSGHWVGRNKECAALVQTKCPNVGLTQSWRRGTRVKGNCNGSKIKAYTAIATFQGPNNSYDTPGYRKQHTAIFVKCDSKGITVYDQYRTSGGVSKRVLKFGSSGNFNGDLYYTIK